MSEKGKRSAYDEEHPIDEEDEGRSQMNEMDEEMEGMDEYGVSSYSNFNLTIKYLVPFWNSNTKAYNSKIC